MTSLIEKKNITLIEVGKATPSKTKNEEICCLSDRKFPRRLRRPWTWRHWILDFASASHIWDRGGVHEHSKHTRKFDICTNSPLFLCDHHLDCFFGGWKMVSYHGRIHKQSPKKQTKDDWSLIHALPCRWRPPMLPPMWLLQRQHWRHCLHYDHASREKQGERHEKRKRKARNKPTMEFFLWSNVY